MRVIDLFSGCGGISLGFKRAGFNVIMGIDNNEPALETFRENFPEAVTFNGDISELDPFTIMETLNLRQGELECLVGGPPCQGFSKNVPAKNRFFDDERNLLVTHFLRFVEAFRPKMVLMENVAELAKAYQNRYTEIILDELESLGYHADWERLLAADFGVPQMRRRAFFLASRISDESLLPDPTHTGNLNDVDLFNYDISPHVNVWEAISDLPPLNHGEGQDIMEYPSEPLTYYQQLMRQNSDGFLYNHKARKLSDIQYQRISSIGEGQGIKDLPEEIRPKSGYSGAYGRLWRDKPAPTITCWVFHPGSGRFSHPIDKRVITIREAARIQSFDDSFKFLGSYNEQSRQVGNAVPPLLAKKIALKYREVLVSQTNHV
ncbi:DNA cytosine methyltransferase [Bacillus haynesii]|uniref:DNA cytosine methyltransferase n=1 Tax=Bacillus haynesii TaxID=1925021 RepID=UPI002281C439|nr:DNA cytosine methyltransferase [Bacillus haynesii]MCY7912993.1 DNA cytosine methyltransferase [Bacillus haynesii]MCY7927200.1 DNA cytosine methyltransferase [Bacillus haynesii]MCY8758338.1 DNA cytosine methyltransferase [Bacillus haynesii]MCY8771899.1 DNA cytosine methyltransferase [Bacillus haynesii]MEC0789371.1 DNA cytosine methyltransferase [Bacillus haynesii]